MSMDDGYPRVARAHAPTTLVAAPSAYGVALAARRGADLVAIHVADDAVPPQRGEGLAAGGRAAAVAARRGAPAAGSGRRAAVPPGVPDADPRLVAVARTAHHRDDLRPGSGRTDGV